METAADLLLHTCPAKLASARGSQYQVSPSEALLSRLTHRDVRGEISAALGAADG